MNAARRAMISQIRHESGCTGKEAYEATKDPSFMKDWVRVAIHDARPDGKPKIVKPPSFRDRQRFLKKQQAIMERNARLKRQPVVIRAHAIQRMLDAGLGLTKALRIARKKYDER